MELSAPIYYLKRKARLLSRAESIPLHEALNRTAAQEGYASWSLLSSKATALSPGSKLYDHLNDGDLVLLGARPGQGKTLLSLQLASEAMKAGHQAVFFTLEYTDKEVLDRFGSLGLDLARHAQRFAVDSSDAICASHIEAVLAQAPTGTLAVIDYLQLLDQRRTNPSLMDQVQSLRLLAKAKGVSFVFISQIARSYDASTKAHPDLEDVRLPNPLDLTLFDLTCFLHEGKVFF